MSSKSQTFGNIKHFTKGDSQRCAIFPPTALNLIFREVSEFQLLLETLDLRVCNGDLVGLDFGHVFLL